MMAGAALLLLGLSLRNVFGAYLLWGWFGLIAVQGYLYGFMREAPYVQVFALIALLLLLLGKDKEKLPYKADGTSLLMVMFGVHCVLSATFAYPGLARNWELCTNVLKTLLFCLVMPLVVTKRYRLHAVIVMVTIGVSFHGLIDGLKFLASGGAHRAIGNFKYGDNNHFAMVLIMGMPLLLYLYQYSKNKLARSGFLGVFFLSCLGVVATGSRGALITLFAVGGWLALISRKKLRYLFTALLAAVLIVSLAPEHWTTRMSTIETAEQDSSFMGRVIAWKRASAIALDYPVLGGGFHAGQAPQLFQQYNYKQGLLGFVSTPPGSYPAASHSIYFEVLGDLGFIGLFWFLLLVFYPILLRRRIRLLAYSRGKEYDWARDCSDMLAASMVAFLVGGAALSAAYFELPYIIVMIMQMLLFILERDSSNQSAPHPAVIGKS